MNTITNLTAVLSSLIVTSYTTNIVGTDNGTYKDCDTGWISSSIPPQVITDRHIVKLPTERYEQITITEHKHAEVTLTNGTVLRQELTNRVVSDRIRTWKLIQTEEFVGEKDVPQLVVTNSVGTGYWVATNVLLWQINNTGTNITVEEKP